MIKIEEFDERFEVKKSTLGNKVGLFSITNIKKGDYLEIVGIMLDVTEICHIATSNYAKIAAEPKSEFCHVIVPCGYAAAINKADLPAKQNVAITHLPAGTITKNPNAGRAIYMAIRNIESGEEIFSGCQDLNKQDDLSIWNNWIGFNFYGLGSLYVNSEKESIGS